MNLGESLLVAVYQRFGKVGQMLVELRNGLGVVAAEDDAFPEILGRVRAFDCFEVEMNLAAFFANGGVLGIGQGTAGAVTEPRDRVGVAAKVRLVRFGLANGGFERTKLVIDHLPDHFIVLHGVAGVCCVLD